MEDMEKNIESPRLLKDYKSMYPTRQLLSNCAFGKQTEQIQRVERFLKEVIERNNFSMCLPVAAFEKVVADDIIKNGVEVGKSTTLGGIEARKEVITNIFGVDCSKYSPSDFPKYGFLSAPDNFGDRIDSLDLFYHYGEVKLNFKKANLMHRTTMTVGSSCDFDESLMKSPTFVDDPKYICIKGMPNHQKAFKLGCFNGVGFFCHLIDDGHLSPNAPNHIADAAEGYIGFENFELQFHGPLRLSADVESIEYLAMADHTEAIMQKLKATKLDALGIPCNPLNINLI